MILNGLELAKVVLSLGLFEQLYKEELLLLHLFLKQ